LWTTTPVDSDFDVVPFRNLDVEEEHGADGLLALRS